MTDNRRQTNDWQFTFRNLIWWACAVAVAVALLQFNPLVGLAAAAIGGVVFGILLFK